MKAKFRNLYEFSKYCEEVKKEPNDQMLLTIMAVNLSEEELLKDVKKCLSMYYGFLKEAVDLELYLIADNIYTAKEVELQHYIDLGRLATKKNVKKQILAIDNELKQTYLLNEPK